ncbi:uncharacterized protein L3040_005846 [Drepanopeziza brunnea f. sp. 'multigermtubi']|uniref:SIS domain-containing protein n=2 Tax=Drepanopeziza brunnea f. sp. 'multigermtubi' TaxID=698441 RepID=K1WTB8_MARBU|nr:SIS domain-containing protein [Drepanopeziza brunnea f. sp. 'multigermtubi' MB_m1]EKD20910.1 SIS domain-containing protein [Drepanopeziza brunnea f. sp. 'multigermtubi' MB_m1]KAJ5041299.1 hypothetical protein L3040_005846 [Drepanopeziza brunnea f. sp. 'multigermtubi']
MDHHPVQNSEVYLMHTSFVAPVPPPSPPSPATSCEESICPASDDELTPITPPESHDLCLSLSSNFNQRLSNAVHVLGTEATSVSALTLLYETEPKARASFYQAVESIIRSRRAKGRLIVSGVGKSGYIGKKLVATMNSLHVVATFLDATEALHGDLGTITEDDTILFITFSGRTAELLQLLQHVDASLPLIIITGARNECAITKRRPGAILLPAPIHQSETEAFGFNAPTMSTTAALALSDALAVSVANELYPNVQAVFSRFHPGGAIGAAAASGPQHISDLAIPFARVPEMSHTALTGAHVLMSAYKSKSGWVRHGDDVVVPPRRIEQMSLADMDEPATCIQRLMVPSKDWIKLPADMSVAHAKAVIASSRVAGELRYADDAILATMVEGEVVGLMEIATLMA